MAAHHVDVERHVFGDFPRDDAVNTLTDLVFALVEVLLAREVRRLVADRRNACHARRDLERRVVEVHHVGDVQDGDLGRAIAASELDRRLEGALRMFGLVKGNHDIGIHADLHFDRAVSRCCSLPLF